MASDKKYMPSSVKPWREQGTPALPRETEDSAVQQGTTWVMCLGMSSLCTRSLPQGGPQTLGVLIENSCGFFSSESNRRENWTECAWEWEVGALPGSLGCIWDEMFPSQRMGIPYLLSVLHLLIKFYLFIVSSTNIIWNVIWSGHNPSLQKLAILCWILFFMSIFEEHMIQIFPILKCLFCAIKEITLCHDYDACSNELYFAFKSLWLVNWNGS